MIALDDILQDPEDEAGEITGAGETAAPGPRPLRRAPVPVPVRSGRPALEVLRSAMPGALSLRVTSARELAREREEEEREPLRTAHPVLDGLLAGGLPRGEMVEVVGGRSSGRLSLMLAALVAATTTGEPAALIDLGDHFDPAAAAASGVDLSRLLWARAPRMKQALAAAEMAIAGGFPLVVVELGLPPLAGGRGLEAGWLRLARAARERGTALLVSSPYRVSGTAAAAVLAARRGRIRWEGEGAGALLAGLASQVVVEKRRGALPGEARGLRLTASPLPAPAAALGIEPPAPARPRAADPAAGAAPARIRAAGRLQSAGRPVGPELVPLQRIGPQPVPLRRAGSSPAARQAGSEQSLDREAGSPAPPPDRREGLEPALRRRIGPEPALRRRIG